MDETPEPDAIKRARTRKTLEMLRAISLTSNISMAGLLKENDNSSSQVRGILIRIDPPIDLKDIEVGS